MATWPERVLRSSRLEPTMFNSRNSWEDVTSKLRMGWGFISSSGQHLF
jgi:hypothetical protein